MLKFIHSLRELDFSQVLPIYEESNLEYGKQNGRSSNPWEQLRLGEENMREDLAAFFRVPNRLLALWYAEGRAVSALRLEPYGDGFLLTCLETIPEARDKGAAKDLLSHTIRSFPGIKIYAHVRKDNAISLAVHQGNGFVITQDYSVLLDGTVSHAFYTLCYMLNKE